MTEPAYMVKKYQLKKVSRSLSFWNWFAPMEAMLKRVPPIPTATRAIPPYKTRKWVLGGGSHVVDPLGHGGDLRAGRVAVNVNRIVPYMSRLIIIKKKGLTIDYH